MSRAGKASVVIESKLYPDVGAAGVMQRSQLQPPQSFVGGRKTVALVSAPAGYGKSTLMSAWHRVLLEGGACCGWLSLDDKDNDPARLMRHLVAAMQRARSTDSTQTELGADFAGEWQPALEAMAVELGATAVPLYLFLDDVHLIRERDPQQILDWLINYAPDHCRLIVGTREAARLRLGKLRVRGKLIEIDEERLRFSEEETGRFLAKRMGRELLSAELRTLTDKTEGWPAALELAGLALRSGADAVGAIDAFSGRDMNVVDYLGEVVMDHLDTRTRDFTLHISQFDRICAELAVEVTDESEAQRLLAGLRAANLFLIPLDRNGQWYRFHQLAGEFLRNRFQRDFGDPRPTLLAGARWLLAHGHTEDAINAAIRAKDWETASQWIADSCDEIVYRRGYHQTIMRWMHELPEEWVDRHPEIRIHYAFALTFTHQRDQVAGQLHRLADIRERLLAAETPDVVLADRIQCEIEIQDLTLRSLGDDGISACREGRQLLARWPDIPLTRRASLGNIVTFGHKTVGAIDEGLAMAEQTRHWCEQGEAWYSLAWIEYLVALLHLKRGHYFEARTAAQSGLQLVRQRLDGHPTHAAMLHAVLATVAYEFDEQTAAREHLDHSLPFLEEGGQADAVIAAFLTAAKLDRQQSGDRAGIERLRQGQTIGERSGLRRVTVSLAAEECGWHSRVGQFEKARAVARRFGFGDFKVGDGTWDLQSEKASLVASRYRLRSDPADVIRQLEAPIERCRSRGLYRRWVELLLLKAIAHRRSGDRGASAAAAVEALTIAAPRHFVRVFLDEPDELLEVFELIDLGSLRGTDTAPLARRLLTAMRTLRAAKGGTTALGSMTVVEHLSKRELSIVKRLESDLTNKEIAAAIFISEGTLKWHLHNIYGKLGVKNRAGALARSRATGLI